MNTARTSKPRILLGSSGKQAKLLQAITRGSRTSPMSSFGRVRGGLFGGALGMRAAKRP